MVNYTQQVSINDKDKQDSWVLIQNIWMSPLSSDSCEDTEADGQSEEQ